MIIFTNTNRLLFLQHYFKQKKINKGVRGADICLINKNSHDKCNNEFVFLHDDSKKLLNK